MDKIKKRKRAKSAIPIGEEVKITQYKVTCPHCRTVLIGAAHKSIDRLFCGYCDNPIILKWEEKER